MCSPSLFYCCIASRVELLEVALDKRIEVISTEICLRAFGKVFKPIGKCVCLTKSTSHEWDLFVFVTRRRLR